MALALKIALLWAALITVVLVVWHRARRRWAEWEPFVGDLGWGDDQEWADR